MGARAEREAAISQRKQAAREDVQEWLAALKTRPGHDGRLFVNEKQFEAVEQVAHRVVEELPSRQGCVPKASPPLRWVVHGGPGTGKSHVIKTIKTERWENLLTWNIEDEFQIVALQAVMADVLQGGAIHPALNLPVFGRGKLNSNDD